MKHDQKSTPLSKKVGDKIERAGRKISDAGARKFGSFITRVGDKIEHSSDPKPDAYNANTIKKTTKK